MPLLRRLGAAIEPWEWPPQLSQVVANHGGSEVYSRGLEVLGFPPTWATEQSEWRVIFNLFRSDEQ
jgi:hypothetical protein